MFDTFRSHGDTLQTPDSIAIFVENWLHSVGSQVLGALVSTAWKEPSSGPSFLTGRVRLAEQLQSPRPTHRYPSVRLEEKWIERAQISSFVAGLVNDAEAERSLPETFGPPSVECIYSIDALETHTRWPETHLKFSSMTGSHATPEWAPAVAPRLPPFLTWAQAVSDWLSLREAIYGQDIPYNGRLVVILPDTRGRALAVTQHDQGIAVKCELRESHDALQLHSVYSRSSRRLSSHTSEIDKAGLAIVPRCHEATQLDVFCVHGVQGVISHKQFTWNELHDALPTNPDAAQEHMYTIAAGENEQVEFKPFIATDSNKLMEIVKVVIAFANADGGRIYVGVTDDGRPEGSGALRNYRSNKDSSGQETMRARLQKLVCDHIKPVPNVAIRWTEIYGEPVCVLDVPSGEVVYASQSNDIWVRKGSSNLRPDPLSELQPLMTRRRGSGTAPL